MLKLYRTDWQVGELNVVSVDPSVKELKHASRIERDRAEQETKWWYITLRGIANLGKGSTTNGSTKVSSA